MMTILTFPTLKYAAKRHFTGFNFMRRPGSKAGLLFRLVVPAVVVFIATILAMIAAVMGDQKAPFWRWLDRNAGFLLIVEFATIIILTLLALTVDRIQALRFETPASCESATPSPASTSPAPPASSTGHNPSQ